MPGVISAGVIKGTPGKLKYYIRLVISFLALKLLGKRLPGCCIRISENELSAAERAIRNGALIIDLRIPEKYNIEHMDDAINIPMEMMAEAYADLPKEREIVLYCGTGAKSPKAAMFLRKKGWKVYDIGTRKEWNERLSGYSRH